MLTEHVFTDAEAAATDMAAKIAAWLAEAIDARGHATIALSGGRSPRPVLEALSAKPIAWDEVVVTLVDERWVTPDSVDSNERLVRKALLQNEGAAATFMAMRNSAADAYAGQPLHEAIARTSHWPIDIVLLGMGEDGHSASLFPGAAELAEGLTTDALTIAVNPPVAPHQRLSLTRHAILSSRRILLQIGGGAKRTVYDRALAGGPMEELPIRLALCQDDVPVDVWITA